MKLPTILLAVLMLPAAARAGVGVSPERVDVSPQRPVALVQLVNKGVDPVSVQATALRWPVLPQAVAPDAAPIVVSPQTLTIAPGRRQMVRIALLDRRADDRERSYRIYFSALPTHRDLPDIGPATPATTVAGVPVVVAGAGSVAPVQWRVASSRKPAVRATKRAAATRQQAARQSREQRAAARVPERSTLARHAQRSGDS